MDLFDDTVTRAMVQTIGADTTGVYNSAEGGDDSVIDVAFRNEFEAAAMFEVSVEESNPVAFVVTSDLTGTVDGGTLLIGSTTWKIIGPGRPDAEGMTMLDLSEVTA